MPRDRRDIRIAAGTSLDLPRAFLVLHLRLAAAQHVADVGRMGVADVPGPAIPISETMTAPAQKPLAQSSTSRSIAGQLKEQRPRRANCWESFTGCGGVGASARSQREPCRR
jgi:hypothetical protein